MSFRNYLFQVVDENEKATKIGKFFNVFIILLILLNVVAIILESFDSLRQEYTHVFYYFEVCSVIIFTVEYLIRAFTADLKFADKSWIRAVLYFVFSPIALIDLFAILPFYLPLIFVVDLRFIRILRILRVSRLFKLNRYSKSLKLLQSVLKEKLPDITVTFFIALLILIISSILMYEVEHDIQPEKFPNVVAAMWWAVATLTTVGYGDIYPVTAFGKIISSVIAILGIGLIAIPTGILSAAFLEKFKSEKMNKKCPTCGSDISNNIE